MNAIVVYESVYGNTRAIAEAVAEGLGGAQVRGTHRVGREARDRVAARGRAAGRVRSSVNGAYRVWSR